MQEYQRSGYDQSSWLRLAPHLNISNAPNLKPALAGNRAIKSLVLSKKQGPPNLAASKIELYGFIKCDRIDFVGSSAIGKIVAWIPGWLSG